jgi:hypothetical protein
MHKVQQPVTSKAGSQAMTPRHRGTANLIPWQKGQSGNPNGPRKGAPYFEALSLAREAGPEAIRKLIELMRTSKDERVVAVACNALLDRGFGKPRDISPADELREGPTVDVNRLTEAQKQALLAAFRTAATNVE